MQKLKLSLSMLIFGTIGVFVRYIPLSSVMIALIRGIIGTVSLFFIIRISGRKLSWQTMRKNFLLLGLSGAAIGFNWIFLFEAYRYTTVATATLCYYMDPVFVMLLSPLVLKERLTAQKVRCILLALVGMLLVSGIWKGTVSSSDEWIGILLGLGAAVLYTAVVFMNKFLKDISAAESTVVQLGMSAAVLFPYALMTEHKGQIFLSGTGILLLLTVGIVHTGIAYWMYFASVQELDGQTIALYSYIDPAFAILLSIFILREPMDAVELVGAVLILGSTLLGELGDRKKE
ncbi:MAG: DMT family transporter [Candidatus Choladocola sp.]|nr:DMT family transporter [Candidatus Choladocola sp.]